MRYLLAVIVVVLVLLGAAAHWVWSPLPVPAGGVELHIDPGRRVRAIAQDVVSAGVPTSAHLLYWWFRASGRERDIRAGSYELAPGTSPWTLLQKLVRGDESLRSVALIDGWNLRQVRRTLERAEALRADSAGLGEDELMQRLGRIGMGAEGRFFPDTYTYSKGASDLSVLRRALLAMDRELENAWQQRSQPARETLKSPQDLLVLASIIEKETGVETDRVRVSAVFHNRLRMGMRLQTDPSVIYGLGEAFDGNLRKADLLRDTPFNTYTRTGLPPTPIAMPGRASLLAAAQPAQTRELYFVARGDGSSQFSETLEQHNQAVRRYQR